MAIAAAAAHYVNDVDAIALDVDSTVLPMVDELVGGSSLTIVTSNLRRLGRGHSSRTGPLYQSHHLGRCRPRGRAQHDRKFCRGQLPHPAC